MLGLLPVLVDADYSSQSLVSENTPEPALPGIHDSASAERPDLRCKAMEYGQLSQVDQLPIRLHPKMLTLPRFNRYTSYLILEFTQQGICNSLFIYYHSNLCAGRMR